MRAKLANPVPDIQDAGKAGAGGSGNDQPWQHPGVELQKHPQHRAHLQHGGHLAHPSRPDDGPAHGEMDDDQAHEQEYVTADDCAGKPQGQPGQVGCVVQAQQHDRRHQQELVGQGVQQRPQFTPLVVTPGDVEDYLDIHGWDESRVTELGKYVKADMVIVIEIGSYSIHEGATLYKGRSDLTIKVFDIAKKGNQVFEKGRKSYRS